MRRRTSFLALTGLTTLAIAAACTTAAVTNPPFDTRDDDDAGRRRDSSRRPPDDEVPEEDPPLPDGAPPPGAVYGHTDTELFLFEPIGKTLTKQGAFACLDTGDRMLDIALDRDGVMFGTSDKGLLRINPTNGSCQYVKKETVASRYPNSLSFVPKDTVDNTQEALVGYQFDVTEGSPATIYVQINTSTGAITRRGELNDPAAAVKYKASGDLIALIRNGNRAFLTVKRIEVPDGGFNNDYLAEVDPKNGRLKSIVGEITVGTTKKTDLWGFSFWAGTGYGFAGNGELLEIDMTTGKSTVIENDAGVTSWFGAGVKTFAPTAPTPTE